MFELFEALEETMEKQKEEETQTEKEISYSAENEKIFVVSVGGSAIVKEKIDTVLIAKLASLFDELFSNERKFVIVVGGGKLARDYVAAAKTLGASNFSLDEIGIKATRINAKLFIEALNNAYPEVCTNIKDSKKIIGINKIPVFGGLMPGFTTDAVSALIAEFLNATFVNLSNVDGIYNKNPKEYSDAVRYETLNYRELIRIIAKSTALAANPSQNVILDLPCALILARSKIPCHVTSAFDLENLRNLFLGREFKGTKIISEENKL